MNGMTSVMRKVLPLVVAMVALLSEAKVLRDIGMDGEGLTYYSFGDKAAIETRVDAQVEGRPVKARLLANPTPRSWGFFVVDVPSGEIPVGGKLRATAWVLSNRPNACRVMISEGVTIGGAPQRVSFGMGAGASERRPISAVIDRLDSQTFFSFGFGFDYSSDGCWMAVDKFVVEHFAEGEEMSMPETDHYTKIDLPPAFLKKALAGDSEKKVSAARQYREKLAKAGLTASAEKVDAAIAASEKTVTALDASEVGSSLSQNLFVCQLLPGMAAFNQETVVPPDGNREWRTAAPANAHASALLLVGNYYSMPISLQCRAEGDADRAISLSRLQNIQRVPDCCVPWQRDDMVELGPQCNVGFELRLATAGLKPGKYVGKIVVEPLDTGFPPIAVPYEFKVIDWIMPAEMPIFTFGCDFGFASEPSSLSFLHEGRVNAFHICLHDRSHFKPLQDAFANVEKTGIRKGCKYFVEVWFVRSSKGWMPEYDEWLRRLVAEFKRAGYCYDDWLLHVYDETFCEEFYRSAQAIRKVDPKVRIYSDKMPKDLAEIEKFSPVVDFWCPHIFTQTEKREENARLTAAMRKTGHEYHIYNCEALPTTSLQTFRLEPWVVWMDKADGMMCWSAMCGKFKTTKPGEFNWGLSYNLSGRIVPSRRWNAWVDGLEDYLLLRRAGEKDDAAARTIAKRIFALRSSPAFVTEVEKARCELMKIIVR